MPFTISHAAAVLPVSRYLARLRVLSAVVIGSMVPDFGLFLPWRPERVETHSITGLYTFALPVGLATWWLFHRLIKPATVELLPDGAYVNALHDAPDLAKPGHWLAAAAGVLVGAVTHLIWDAFTHEGARGVRMIPALDDPVVDIAGHLLMAFKFIQLASSLAGLAVVIWIARRALRAPAAAPVPPRRLSPHQRRAWTAAYGVSALLAAAALFAYSHWDELLVHTVVGGIASGIAIAALQGLGAALVGVSACLAFRLRESG
jgi:hypothetical protein